MRKRKMRGQWGKRRKRQGCFRLEKYKGGKVDEGWWKWGGEGEEVDEDRGDKGNSGVGMVWGKGIDEDVNEEMNKKEAVIKEVRGGNGREVEWTGLNWDGEGRLISTYKEEWNTGGQRGKDSLEGLLGRAYWQERVEGLPPLKWYGRRWRKGQEEGRYMEKRYGWGDRLRLKG